MAIAKPVPAGTASPNGSNPPPQIILWWTGDNHV